MTTKATDIIRTKVAVVGAGPAGSTASICLAKEKIEHVIFDKAVFPREKVCGDGLSGKVVHLLQEIDSGLLDAMARQTDKFLGSWGVRFVAPNGKELEVPYKDKDGQSKYAPGYVARRMDFDYFLVQNLDPRWSDRRFGYELKAVQPEKDHIRLEFRHAGRTVVCQADLVIAADGDRSRIARQLNGRRMRTNHYYAGIRAYYRNVTGLSERNYIELHFVKEALPGYFWIFPLPGGSVNAGLDMPADEVRRKRINLRRLMETIIKEHPEISARFRGAEREGRISGWGLPIAAENHPLSGERFMLTGDAGALIDPFTGEGIGNAMISGRLAAQVAANAVRENDYSARRLSVYDGLVRERLQKELELSEKIRRLARRPWLFNFLFSRINANAKMRELFSNMYNDLDVRAKLKTPSFYLRLLLNKEKDRSRPVVPE